MEIINWLIEIVLCVCLIVLVNVDAPDRVVIMAATFYLAEVIREGKRNGE